METHTREHAGRTLSEAPRPGPVRRAAPGPPHVIMRACNDMPLIADTLRILARQRMPFKLIVYDDGSTDGTREEACRYTDRVCPVPGGSYVPGRVLNHAMAASTGEYVVFLNSDCTPVDEYWLERLLAGFTTPAVAAVFGRQIPRPDCRLLYRRDTDTTFGDGASQARWRHCFSMASSAIRRSVWEQCRFDEQLQYSEDIDWTWRVRQRGYRIGYVPDSVVTHSHNYSWRAFYRRQYGEGRADALIFDWPRWPRSFLRYSLLPYGRQVLADWRYCLRHGAVGSGLYAPVLRLAQLWGRRAGFCVGLQEKARAG